MGERLQEKERHRMKHNEPYGFSYRKLVQVTFRMARRSHAGYVVTWYIVW